MALRDGYSSFKFFEMFPASHWGRPDIPFGSNEQSSYSIDTRGYETVTFIVNVGSCDVDGPTSAMAIALAHAHSYTAASYDYVSATELMGSDINMDSAYTVSFGGSMALTNGVVLNFAMPAASTTDGQSMWVFGYRGGRRYLKLLLRGSGTMNTGSINMTAIGILGEPVEWPVNDPNP
jgi:hypothetical protein